MSREDYLYAAGVVRFLENKLLNPTDVERMIDAPDLVSSFKVFHDTDYFDNLLEVSPDNFLQALDEDLQQVKDKIIEMTPDQAVLRFLFMRYDFHNLKVLLKAKQLGKALDEHISKLGLVEFQSLKTAVTDNLVNDLPGYIRRALTGFHQQLGRQVPGPAVIDQIVDLSYFHEYQAQGHKLNSLFISDLVKLQIDIANIKIFLRSANLGITAEFIAGGQVPVREYQLAGQAPSNESLIQLSGYFDRWLLESIQKYFKHQQLEVLEKDLENTELEYLRQAKFLDFGPEIVVAYYYAKKNAIRNVRLIMTGKLNNIPSSDIKALVREIY